VPRCLPPSPRFGRSSRRRSATSFPPQATAGAPPWGKDARQPFPLFPPAFLRSRDLVVSAVPHAAVVRLPRSHALRLNPTNAFPISFSFSPSKPGLNPHPKMHLRVRPGEPPPSTAAPPRRRRPTPPLHAPSCGRTNLNYTGSSMRVHFGGLQHASNGIIPWPVG
jgi:hypothetical protein